jgi:mannose-6-phosphate isomerase
MTSLPPLRFEPIFKQYLWGGRRLESLLGKRLGPGPHFAESWEVVDHGQDQSVVSAGPLQGTTLHALVAQHGAALLGRHHPQPRFPLLMKLLDAHQTLSVQVHPNDHQAALLDPPDSGKTEAWVILAADPGSKIYAGLKPGVDRVTLASEVQNGTCNTCLHQFEPHVGDCIFLESGTVHAIGAGLVVAEIQQASDTTYRLFDWNRVDDDGQPRQLHVREALDTIDFRRGPVTPQRPQPTDQPQRERLVACDKFVLDRWRLDAPVAADGNDRFHILSVVEGEATVVAGADQERLPRGNTILLPACCPAYSVRPRGGAVLLDMYLP